MKEPLKVSDEGEVTGTLPCGHSASHLRAGWHYRVLCSECWSAHVRIDRVERKTGYQEAVEEKCES